MLEVGRIQARFPILLPTDKIELPNMDPHAVSSSPAPSSHPLDPEPHSHHLHAPPWLCSTVSAKNFPHTLLCLADLFLSPRRKEAASFSTRKPSVTPLRLGYCVPEAPGLPPQPSSHCPSLHKSSLCPSPPTKPSSSRTVSFAGKHQTPVRAAGMGGMAADTGGVPTMHQLSHGNTFHHTEWLDFPCTQRKSHRPSACLPTGPGVLP